MRAALFRGLQARHSMYVRGLHVPYHHQGKVEVKSPVSLDRRMTHGGDGKNDKTLGDLVAVAPEPEEQPEFPADFWDRLDIAIPAHYRRVLEMRFRGGLTLNQIGERIGKTRERVRQIIERSLDKLRTNTATGYAQMLEAG